jgi:phospholipid/cholesterol/gamma-HCH transport system substrate-binding protein
LATTIEQNSSNIDQVLKDAPKLVADLGVAAENAKSITAALARNEPHIDSILADTASFVSGLGTTQSRLDGVLDDARGILKGVDAGKVEAIVDDIRRVADSFDQGRGKITAIFNDTAGFTGRLSGMADRLDSVLNGANGLLGSGEAKGALVEVGAAAHSIRILADHLDERTKDITTGINRFTGSGLRDLEAIATDGKRTLGNIDRTLTSVQRNPQQFLLGTKSPIPEYSSGQ